MRSKEKFITVTQGHDDLCSFIKTYVQQYSPPTTILHFVSTQDTAFLYRSQSKHIPGRQRDNHNIFCKHPDPAADSPYALSITIWSADTSLNPELASHGRHTATCVDVVEKKSRGGVNREGKCRDIPR